MRHSNKGEKLLRRKFLSAAGAIAGGVVLGASVVPRTALGSAQRPAPSQRVNLAMIGVGSQGLRVMFNFLREPDVQIVAVCDANRQSSDYHQWAHNEFCNSVRRLLGVNSGWEWLSPNKPLRLTQLLTVTSGTAGYEPARQIVEAYYGKDRPAGQYKGCKTYADFRELLEKQSDVDAVVVCTHDTLHAPVAIAAMRKGKHVWCQKPMTYSVAEARKMAQVARETAVATQVAVANAASEDTRRLCEWVASGAIGPVREVINWSSRPFWPQAIERPAETPPVPEGLNWELWLGPSPHRPYHPVYLPFVWRGWYDFGCGALGDMGCYSFDTIFRVLKLEAPDWVEASTSEPYPETYPAASIVRYQFPARGDMPPVRLTWYDGGLLPARPEELEPSRPLPREGLMFIGDGGIILAGFTGQKPQLLPESRMKAFQEPPKTLSRRPDISRQWLDAAKGAGEKPDANFEFTAVVTEALQLGNVAVRTRERLLWNRADMKVTNIQAANKYVAPEYRTGWTL